MNRIVLIFLFFSGLTYTHAAGISVDSIPPTITCPPNVTLTLGATTCDTVYEYTVTVEDDQPGVTYGLVTGLQPGDTFPVGATVNLFLAIDAGGNTASCSFSVQVVGGARAVVDV